MAERTEEPPANTDAVRPDESVGFSRPRGDGAAASGVPLAAEGQAPCEVVVGDWPPPLIPLSLKEFAARAAGPIVLPVEVGPPPLTAPLPGRSGEPAAAWPPGCSFVGDGSPPLIPFDLFLGSYEGPPGSPNGMPMREHGSPAAVPHPGAFGRADPRPVL